MQIQKNNKNILKVLTFRAGRGLRGQSIAIQVLGPYFYPSEPIK